MPSLVLLRQEWVSERRSCWESRNHKDPPGTASDVVCVRFSIIRMGVSALFYVYHFVFAEILLECTRLLDGICSGRTCSKVCRWQRKAAAPIAYR